MRQIEDWEREQLKSPVAAASTMAALPALLWSASFLCHMFGLKYTLLGHVGNILGFYSVYIVYKSIKVYKIIFEETSLLKCIRIAVLTGIFSCLVTSLVQFAYFMLLDNGKFLTGILSVLEAPGYSEMLSQMSPQGPGVEEITRMLTEMTVSDITIQMGMMNLLIAVPACAMLAILAYARMKTKHQTYKQD